MPVPHLHVPFLCLCRACVASKLRWCAPRACSLQLSSYICLLLFASLLLRLHGSRVHSTLANEPFQAWNLGWGWRRALPPRSPPPPPLPPNPPTPHQCLPSPAPTTRTLQADWTTHAPGCGMVVHGVGLYATACACRAMHSTAALCGLVCIIIMVVVVVHNARHALHARTLLMSYRQQAPAGRRYYKSNHANGLYHCMLLHVKKPLLADALCTCSGSNSNVQAGPAHCRGGPIGSP